MGLFGGAERQEGGLGSTPAPAHTQVKGYDSLPLKERVMVNAIVAGFAEALADDRVKRGFQP